MSLQWLAYPPPESPPDLHSDVFRAVGLVHLFGFLEVESGLDARFQSPLSFRPLIQGVPQLPQLSNSGIHPPLVAVSADTFDGCG